MSGAGALPKSAALLARFAPVLRAHGFAASTDQTMSFLAAVLALGPRDIDDIRRAARAVFGPAPERRDEFDALFRAHFLAEFALATEAADAADDELRARDDDARGVIQPPASDAATDSGAMATALEILAERRLDAGDETELLRRFARAAPARLPRRRAYRRVAARRGREFDLRRALKRALRDDGDVVSLPRRRRKQRLRRVLLLIDVSGSMKARTDAHLRFAHALTHAAGPIEVFTFGTRLTRVTRAMQLKRREQALAAAAGMVADWDGGTRIGDALQAFLAVPRFAGYARGALTVVLSDGLERGDPAAMVDAVGRLARRAWRLSWLSPLAADPGFRPETAALKAILPLLDDLSDGGSTEALCAHVLVAARRTA